MIPRVEWWWRCARCFLWKLFSNFWTKLEFCKLKSQKHTLTTMYHNNEGAL